MQKKILLSTLALSIITINASMLSTDVDDRTSIHMTIYNNDLALIKDNRIINNNKSDEVVNLEFKDVSGKINARSSILKGAGNIYEQNFSYDLLSQQSLFERHIGKEVTLRDIEEKNTKKVNILNVINGNAIVQDKIENKIYSININNENYTFMFNEIPDNLRVKPTLSMKVKDLSENISLTYLTSGLSWSADYVANLNKEATEMNISGWVTLNNNSLTTYNDVNLSLIAGDLNMVSAVPANMKAMRSMVMAESIDMSLDSETVGDYKKYTVPFKVDIENNQQKQVALLNKNNVPVKKIYEYELNIEGNVSKLKAPVFIKFKNDKENKLGLPLPAGTIRYYEENENSTDFIGENRIGQTSINETIKTKIGEAFDITLNKNIIDNRRINSNEIVVTVNYEIINGSNQTKEVVLNERSYGRLVEIISSDRNVNILEENNNLSKKFYVEVKPDSIKKFSIQYKITRN